MKKTITSLLVLLSVAFSGCNSDIFIDEPDWEEFRNITIDGDGGEATLDIPVKDLEFIGLDLFSESKKYCTCYNMQGEIIDPNSPASEISRIVFETKFTKLEFMKDGTKLTVKSICQTSNYDSNWTIRLEYSYGVRFIELKVLPGRPLQLLEVVYDDLVTDDRAKVSISREGFTNNGPLPQTLTLRPYLNELASILVEPKERNIWLWGERMDMPVPVYINGEWLIRDKSGIMPGTKYTYEGPDRLTEINIEVPAQTHVNIYTDVVYTGATANGRMVFHNEILDLTFSEEITVSSLYPTHHEIRIEDAK